jgi:putative membrane protein
MGVLLLPLVAVLYAIGVRRLQANGHRWPAARTLAFSAGLAALALATLPPLGPAEVERFSAHVLQHVLLGMVAPLALALGAPVTLALRASGRPVRRRLLRLLHSRPVALLTHPVVGWVLFGGTLFALYFSPLFGLSLRSRLVHEVLHLHFLAAGCLFVVPLVGLDPVRPRLSHGARLLAVLLAVPLHAFLGMALLQSERILGGGGWSLADQHLGAGLLWATGDLLAGIAAVVIFFQWVASDERQATRLDRRGAAVGAGAAREGQQSPAS